MTELGKFSLDPLNSKQAMRLIAARLEGTEHPQPPWPLDRAEFDKLTGGIGVTPRKLLNRCAERFDDQRSAPKPQPATVGDPVEAFFADTWDNRLEEKLRENAPDHTENIIRHGFPLLAQIVAPELEMVRDEELPDVSLVFAGPRGHAGVSICSQSNMNSLAARLKRLKTQFDENRLRQLVVVRDSRIPISPGAKKTRAHLDDLEQQGAVIYHPTTDALAALDALRELLSDAKSGDLSYGGEAVAPSTLEAWILSHLPSDLAELTDKILGGPPGGSDAGRAASDAHEIEALNGLLSQNPVMPLHEAADALRRPVEDVAETVRRHPGQFRMLGQPPSLMFRAVEGAGSWELG